MADKEIIEKLNSSMKYIEDSIKKGENITNEKLSKILGYEQHYFAKRFREFFGHSIQEYIKKRKMTLASYELINSKKKIIDIASKYGYSTDGFTKAFRDVHKITPKQFRKLGKIQNEYVTMIAEDIETLPFEIKSCNILDKEEMKFVGLLEKSQYNNIEFFEKCMHLKNEFETFAMFNCNNRYYEISHNLKQKYEYILAYYYNPLEKFPKEFETIKIHKQKWLIVEGTSYCLDSAIRYCRGFALNKWLKEHKEYEIDDNYEIAFQKINYDYIQDSIEKYEVWAEIWIPIKEKKK